MTEDRDGQRDRLAVLHIISEGHVKATCSVHPRCSVWLSLKGRSLDQGMSDLSVWIASAAKCSDNVDEDEHWRRGIALKRSYGMNVKK